MKQLCLFISILITMHMLFSPMIVCLEGTKPVKINLDFMNYPDQNLYWQGWIKYFHYNNSTQLQKPRAFFQNNDYFHQRIPNYLINERDAYGLISIPSKHSFFLSIFNDSLTFHTTRNQILQKSYDSLKIDHINLVPEDKPLKGGVKDLGNFDEGKCFQIKATEPRYYRKNFNPLNNRHGIIQTWILCSNDERTKATLMNLIVNLKLKSQRNRGAVLTLDSITQRKKGFKVNLNFGKKPKKNQPPVNGYWVLLQNWTECTLKCGGGHSYQQWLCIPPKYGGKKCTGTSVKVRECNKIKCPSTGVILKRHLLEQKKDEEKAATPPIIKVAPFSTLPQRYSKCILKENDAFITDFNPETQEITKQPIRLVMNNKTVTLYGDEDYENKIYTYNIDATTITRSREFCCIHFRDSLKNYKICAFTSNCGTRLNNMWVENWIKDFKLFKHDCRTKRTESSTDRNRVYRKNIRNKKKNGEEDIGEIFDDTNPSKNSGGMISGDAPANAIIGPGGVPNGKPLNELQKQAAKFQAKFARNLQSKIIGSKEKKILKNVRKAQKRVARGKVMQTEKMGMAVMGKEIELENLVKYEEKKKENRQLKKILKMIKKEKKKRSCLKKTLKKRELDTRILMDKRESEKEITHVKEEMKMEVQMKRDEMKRQISQMRKKARRRRAAAENKLNKIRSKMARDIMAANKEGDIEYCRKGKKSPNERDTYCNNNFVDDYLKNYDCKSQDTFGYMCCENEFGNNFIEKRDECYEMCDGTTKGKTTIPSRTSKPKIPKTKIALDVVAKSIMSKSKGGQMPKKTKKGGWVWTPKVPPMNKRH